MKFRERRLDGECRLELPEDLFFGEFSVPTFQLALNSDPFSRVIIADADDIETVLILTTSPQALKIRVL